MASESATDPIFIGENNNQMKPMKLSFKPSEPEEPIEGSLSPKIIKQEPRSSGKQPSHLLYKNLDDYSAAKEYQLKIEKLKKDNFKYRGKRNEEKSIDDKIKTKQLLKNIDLNKLFNRRSLLSGNEGQTRTNTGIPKAPRTTMAASNFKAPINLNKQNKKASSIDDPN